mmetsp:Transcript_25949/g.46109  ORF Transcript_25949/g.46109 Transcript_25949/m.46109 type:complete len:865 (-) Transcript_25949:313-2907(-)
MLLRYAKRQILAQRLRPLTSKCTSISRGSAIQSRMLTGYGQGAMRSLRSTNPSLPALRRLLSIGSHWNPEPRKDLEHEQEHVVAMPIESHTFQSNPGSSSLPGISIFEAVKSMASRIFAKIPKGFGNFYPEGDKEKEKNEEKESAADEKDENAKEDDKNDFANLFGGGGGNGGRDGGEGERPPGAGNEPWIMLFLGLIFATFLVSSMGQRGQDITFQEFVTGFLERGEVDRIVVINKTRAHFTTRGGSYSPNGDYSSSNQTGEREYYFNIGSIEAFERRMEEIQREMGIEPRDFVPIQYSNEANIGTEIMKSLPSIILIGLLFAYMRNMSAMGGGGGGAGGRNIFSIGKANPTVVSSPGKIKTRFKDVAGLGEAKVEIMEFVKFLKDPKRFTKLGAKIPKGALLVGPPGTGKTLLAKATAGEANVPFYSMSGSDFIEMFVGVGPSRVRDLFSKARQNAPCIVFIDEIDAVGRSRSKGGFGGGNDERENTLNQLLVEMDGFKEQTGVVVLAGTNRADILDSALLRPGRFDRQILVDKPDINGRRQIFEVHLKPLTLKDKPEFLAERLAALTPGFAGADIGNLCNEAAIVAARAGKDAIELVDFEQATDRVIGGLEKKNKVISKQEKELIAYHEAGHAVVGWFLEHADPLLKVTIIPRGPAALGYAQYLPKEVALYNPDQLLDMMCMALGGRAAEQVFFNKISTGASNDLQKVTQQAYAQVNQFGFSEKLGHVNFQQDDQSFQKPYSEATAQMIDEEARVMIEGAYKRTIDVVEQYRDKCEALAKTLLEKETINHDDIVSILGDRPFDTDAYQEYLKNTRKKQEEFENELDDMNNDGEESKEKGEEQQEGEVQPGLAMEESPEPTK